MPVVSVMIDTVPPRPGVSPTVLTSCFGMAVKPGGMWPLAGTSGVTPVNGTYVGSVTPPATTGAGRAPPAAGAAAAGAAWLEVVAGAVVGPEVGAMPPGPGTEWPGVAVLGGVALGAAGLRAQA